MKDFLCSQEILILEEGHRSSQKRRYADRIKSILMLNKGYSFGEIADILMVDDSSVRRWHRQYVQGGIDVLIEDNYSGSNPSLLPCAQKELEVYLEQHTYLTAKQVASYVETTYGVGYSLSGITELLHRLGFVYKKTKKLPGKADGEKQKEFVEDYEQLKANKKAEDQIYFMDGCHPLHNSVSAYGWIKKGKVKEIKSNTGRKRLNINGAYNIENHQMIYREDQTINAQSTCELLAQIIEKHPVGMIYIIADNARYYRSKIVQGYLKNHPRVKIIFLPPYAPNLNTIERLWLFFKKKILYNKYYESFQEFRLGCLNFFDNLDRYRDELKSLMTDKWEILDANFSQT